MTVSGIGSTSQALANTAIDPNSWQTRMQQTLGPVAQLFGMSTSQLEQALQSGESLNDIASSAGVSQTDLTNAIKAGIQQAQPAGAAPLSDTQLTNLANRIAGHHHHHHGGGAPSATASPSSTSSTNPLAAVEQDLDQLLTDLSTALAGNGSTPASTAGGGTTPTNPLTQSISVDQQL
jgi:hypothetical protein